MLSFVRQGPREIAGFVRDEGQRKVPLQKVRLLKSKEKPMRNNFLLRAALLLVSGALLLFAVACNGANPSNNSGGNSPMNVAGNWTLTVTSTQGQGTVSATADVTQSGQGIGANGTTTLSGAAGNISIAQSGTNLTGILTNGINGVNYNFLGTLSGSNITIAGSVACGMGVQSTSITGTISSTKMHGTYTVTRDSACFHPSDAGAWAATKQ